MKILIICHNPIYTAQPRGAENSVRAIVEFLRSKEHIVDPLDEMPDLDFVKGYDIVLSWGKPAQMAAMLSKAAGVPFVLMVRWWRNIAPRPVGNLMDRPVNERFQRERKKMFEYASAIITNTDYSKQVIHKWQPASIGKTYVSYVPILGQARESGDPNGTITIVTPEIYGESWLIRGLAKLMTEETFQVVNVKPEYQFDWAGMPDNVKIFPYRNMDHVWSSTKLLLNCVYGNDICGTRRVTIEAFRHTIPVLASNKCGMDEKVPQMMLMAPDANVRDWAERINHINSNIDNYKTMARAAWMMYDTPGQMMGFESILLNVKARSCA